jgi:hypothetical protein
MGVGGLSLEGLGFLLDHTVEIEVPPTLGRRQSGPIAVRVPTLPAFMVHKGVTFPRRGDADRMGKDLLYLVEIMSEGDPLVAALEAEIRHFCADGSTAAAPVARKARNNVSLAIARDENVPILRAAEAFALRRGMGRDGAEARVRGFLQDFVQMIPEDCG